MRPLPTVRNSVFRALLLLVGLLALVLLGCARDGVQQLVQVLDIAPREAEVGDRMEVLGAGFPQGRTARVTFKGALKRPGEAAVANATITTDGQVTSPQQIEFPFTESLQALFCGAGDHARHTTFEGEVEIAFSPASPGAPPVAGTLSRVVLDFRPPTPRRAIADAQLAEGERTLSFVGIVPAPNTLPGGGLLVKSVAPGSPAEKAGIAAGDLITECDGVRVASKADMQPSALRMLTLAIRRGTSSRDELRQIPLDGLKRGTPTALLGAAIVLVLAIAVIALFMAPTAGIITWFERRVAGRMQSRIGPNRAGPHGFFVWVADGVKSLLKEDIIPDGADKPLFRLSPYLVFAGVSATFVVMPFGQYLIAADLDIGILFVVAVTSLVTIGLMTGGWASNNKYSLLGGIRSAAQIVSYEVPAAFAIVCIVLMTGSLRMQEIVRAQGGFPWDWFMFRNPVTFGLFFLYFTTALAEGNRAPFDLPEAESELVAGYSTEYSGMRYVFFFFAEWANVFVMSGIAAALFLGGWQIPGLAPGAQEANFGLQLLGAFLFLAKAWFLVFVVIWVRWTLPRIRIDQLMSMCWKYLVPLSFVAFLLTAGWVAWSPTRTVELVISVATFVFFCFVSLHFVRRVQFNLRESRVEMHLNPFL